MSIRVEWTYADSTYEATHDPIQNRRLDPDPISVDLAAKGFPITVWVERESGYAHVLRLSREEAMDLRQKLSGALLLTGTPRTGIQ